MSYNNSENKPIVGEENSHQSLKQEIIEEGSISWINGGNLSDNPYAKGSTFWKWWREGWLTI